MDGIPPPPVAPPRRMPAWLWLLGCVALLGWQGWLALGLFGERPVEALLDDRPVVSGCHPQHLYLGTIGAEALWDRMQTSVFDASFQAGYLKTPIFDGSRLAELVLFVGGGTYQPAAYKAGIVGVCLLVPLLLLAASVGFGLTRSASLLATFLGQLVWWGPLGRGALDAGDSELLLAALSGLAHLGLLVAFHRRPGVWNWLGMLLTGCLGWFLQPLLFPIALPLLLVYYLSVGVKHDFLTWHVAFWGAEQAAVAANLPWLVDWVAYWWLRAPLPSPTSVLEHRTLGAVWNAPLWGGPADRTLTLLVVLGAVVGVSVMNATRQRPAARLLGLGSGGALTLALLGVSWEPLGVVGSAGLLAPALWFAALPAAHAWVWLASLLWNAGASGRVVLVLMAAVTIAGAASVGDSVGCLVGRCVYAQPLVVGLNDERAQLVEQLKQYTTADARVLWEDRPVPRRGSRWAALLPLLTQRSYVGGLDPDGFIEHASISLMNQSLKGIPMGTWKDGQLDDYCDLYNVGWVVAWSPAVVQRLEAWPAAEKVVPVRDGDEGWLFRVKRDHTFTLRGRAGLVHADGRCVTLADVVPDNGVVVLSLHYQAGMRASPPRVQVEREPSGDDPIGFVRLRLAEPATSVIVRWER